MNLKERVYKVADEVVTGKNLLVNTLGMENKNPTFEEINNEVIKLKNQANPLLLKGLQINPLYWGDNKWGYATQEGNNSTTMIVIDKSGEIVKHRIGHIFSNVWSFASVTGSIFGKVHGRNVIPYYIADKNNQRFTLLDRDSGEILYHGANPLGFTTPDIMFTFKNKVFYNLKNVMYVYDILPDFTISPTVVNFSLLLGLPEYNFTQRIFTVKPDPTGLDKEGLLFLIICSPNASNLQNNPDWYPKVGQFNDTFTAVIQRSNFPGRISANSIECCYREISLVKGDLYLGYMAKVNAQSILGYHYFPGFINYEFPSNYSEISAQPLPTQPAPLGGGYGNQNSNNYYEWKNCRVVNSANSTLPITII